VYLEEGVFRRAQGLFYEASTLGNFCAFFLVMIMVCLFRRREETPLSRAAVQAGDRAHLPAQSTRQFLGSVPVNHFNLIYATRSPLLGSFTGLP